MNKALILAIVIAIVVILGCRKMSEDKITEKQIEHHAGSGENVDISDESLSVKIKNDEFKMDTDEKAKNLKDERKLKKEEARPINLSDDNFEGEVLESDVPVLVDFWAPWCGPCRMAAPVLEKIAQEYAGSIKVCKLNVDEGRQTAMKYSIRSIPTLNIYKDGEVVDQIIGVTPNYESDIQSKIKPLLGQ